MAECRQPPVLRQAELGVVLIQKAGKAPFPCLTKFVENAKTGEIFMRQAAQISGVKRSAFHKTMVIC